MINRIRLLNKLSRALGYSSHWSVNFEFFYTANDILHYATFTVPDRRRRKDIPNR